MQQRLPSLTDRPICFAHRGARAHAPENTIEAFELALRLGANGLETDAWVTRDSHVILDHDGVVRRLARKIPIRSLDLEDLPTHIPTLRAVLHDLRRPYDLSIDVKDGAASDLIVGLIEESGFPPDRAWLCYHALEDTIDARRRLVGVRVVDSARLGRISEGVERRAATLAAYGVDALNMHATDWNGGLVTLVHRFNLFAFGWDMQHDHVLDNGFRMGLDAVYSDYVDRMVDSHRREVGLDPRG